MLKRSVTVAAALLAAVAWSCGGKGGPPAPGAGKSGGSEAGTSRETPEPSAEKAAKPEPAAAPGSRAMELLAGLRPEIEKGLGFFDNLVPPGAPEDERRRGLGKLLSQLEEALDRLPKDRDGRAVSTAVRGWAHFRAGFVGEAFSEFEKSRETLGGGGPGLFLKACSLLSVYLRSVGYPPIAFGVEGCETGTMPPEGAEQKEAFERIAVLESDALRAAKQGEPKTLALLALAKAVRGAPSGGVAGALEAVSEALDDGGFSWLEADLAAVRAYLKVALGKAEEALADIESAVALRPLDRVLALNAGNFHFAAGMEKAGGGEDPSELLGKAERHYLKGLGEADPSAAVKLNLAALYIQYGRLSSAAGLPPSQYLKKASSLVLPLAREKKPEALLLVGTLLLVNGEFEMLRANPKEAAKSLGEAVRYSSSALEASAPAARALALRGASRVKLAAAQGALGSDPRAVLEAGLADFDSALAEAPGNALLLSNRAAARFDLGRSIESGGGDARPQFRLAVEDGSAALAAKPGNFNGLLNRGNAFYALAQAEQRTGGEAGGFFDKAVADFDAAAGVKPDARAFFNKGKAVQGIAGILAARRENAEARLNEALACWDEALRINAKFYQALDNKARGLEKLGRFEEALETIEEAQRLTGGRLPSINEFAEKMKAILAGPEWAGSLHAAQWALSIGNIARAVETYEKGLARAEDPSADEALRKALVPTAFYNLACCYGRLAAAAGGDSSGLRAKALDALRKAFEGGFGDAETAMNDPDLSVLKEEPGFRELTGGKK